MRVIILAAGQGFQIDGLNKCLIRDPLDGRRIIDKMIEAFKGYTVTIVVGYQAIAIMQDYPQLHYVYNYDWGITNNSYSLGLALTEEPCYVLSCDFLFEPELIKMMDNAGENIILTEIRENRTASAIHCITDNHRVFEAYQGILRHHQDPEAIGIFKISHRELLKQWKTNCLNYKNLFIAQNLPLDINHAEIYSCDKGNHRFFEINTPYDYIRLIEDNRLN